MRSICLILLASTLIMGDYIKDMAVACPQIESLKLIVKVEAEGGDVHKFLFNHACRVLDKQQKIQVLNANEPIEGKYLRILVPKTNEILYINQSRVQVEQSGDRNIFRF